MNDLFKPDDTRDALRKIGGLLFALGAAMIYIRKGPAFAINPSQWAAFPIFLVLAIPAAYLYGGILTRRQTGELRTWRSEEHTSELQSLTNIVCRLLLEK